MVELNRCPSVLDICISRGDDQPLSITFMDPGGTTPTDLTGKSYKLTVDSREEPDDASTKVFDVTGVNGAILSAGIVAFPFATANVAELLDVFCDIQETNASAKDLTATKGKFVIEQDITK